MKNRVWGYGFLSIALLAGAIFWQLELRKIEYDKNRIIEDRRAESLLGWQEYLARQTDERKLVSLLKKIPHEDYQILKKIALRAYQLNSQSRDIALIASQFDPSIRQRVLQLDPLHNLK